MGRSEIRNICKVSLDEPAENQPKLHNRWHPDIPFADTVKNGETVKIECVDWTGGQISVFAKENGGGFLDEILPNGRQGHLGFRGHLLFFTTYPTCEVSWIDTPGNSWLCTLSRGHILEFVIIVAQPPNPQNVHAGSASQDLKTIVGREGARTIPGRPEHGGNCDIKNLSRGSKVYLPVHVKGAKFSVGDLHFSQGDGEISFCGAIEMSGVITINFKVMKNGIADLGMKSPIYLPGPVEPHYGPGRYLTFEGFSVDHHGKQHFMDVSVAYRETILRCIEYLRRFGYSDYQIYLLLSCAPVQGHVAGIVDIPNACTTLGLPMDIF
ncbi:hypothetical protein DID88_001601 [Monilinia fructigena]|uniref:Formamidase n=1 Tax=Monilinia fructigena TaxID=38457 RepID=A0A395IX51_9HELO|nr:hypothetical protein DID88_001601 [Monilinia fructigena]